MKHVGSYEAKTHLPQLLDSVERGESVVINRNGQPAAQLVPVTSQGADMRAIIADLKAFGASRHRTLGHFLARTLIEDGRRF